MTREEAAVILKRSEKELNDALAEMTMNEKTAAAIQRYIDAYSMAIDGLLKQVGIADTDVGKMEPLTLEELLKMDGEPVWIVEYPDWGHWELSADAGDYVADRDYDRYGMKHDDPDGRYGLHKLGWLAFRKKPEEDHGV